MQELLPVLETQESKLTQEQFLRIKALELVLSRQEFFKSNVILEAEKVYNFINKGLVTESN